MVQKKYPRKGTQVRVTFELPATDGRSVAVLGDFNGWQPDALPMKLRKKDGVFTAAADLPQGATYQFRYLVDGQEWVTDHEADGVVMSPFGQPNAVLAL
jgi:1,4-alpha-glucan branching enzyme